MASKNDAGGIAEKAQWIRFKVTDLHGELLGWIHRPTVESAESLARDVFKVQVILVAEK